MSILSTQHKQILQICRISMILSLCGLAQLRRVGDTITNVKSFVITFFYMHHIFIWSQSDKPNGSVFVHGHCPRHCQSPGPNVCRNRERL